MTFLLVNIQQKVKKVRYLRNNKNVIKSIQILYILLRKNQYRFKKLINLKSKAEKGFI